MNPIRLYYIIGYPRSGTTLLGNVIGSMPEYIHVGEISRVWKTGEKSEIPDRRCGCIKMIPECDFWVPVMQESFEQVKSETGEEIDNFRLARIRDRIIYEKPVNDSDKELFTLFTGIFYRKIQEHSHADLIVDSSKDLSYAKFLESTGLFDITYIHIVRHIGGVGLSRQKKLKKETSGGKVKLNYKYFLYDLLNWVYMNRKISIFGKGKKYHRISYDEFTFRPKELLMDKLDNDLSKIFVNDHTFSSRNLHTVMGNRNRFKKGEIEIRKDRRWEKQLNGRDKALANFFNKFA